MKRLLCVLITLQLITAFGLYAQNSGIAFRAYESRMNGNPEMALSLLDSALKVTPDNAELWFEKGRCLDWIKLQNCKKFTDVWRILKPTLKDCRYCFRKACHYEPGNARYHYWAGQNAMTIALVEFYTPWEWLLIPGVMNSAVKHLKKSVLLNPVNPEYRYNLINVLHFGWLLSGNRKLALLHTDTISETDPVYGVMAKELMETGKQPYDPYPEYRKLLQSDPDNIRLLSEVAALYSRKGDSCRDTAIAMYRRILELEPDNINALKRLYWTVPASDKDLVVPYILSYFRAVDNNYNYYTASGMQLLATYLKQLHDEQRGAVLSLAAERLHPDNYGTFINDIGPP
ncbi:hypothetical protein TBC1_112036 [Lentimicrobium saccharophilum]|uniref:Uncharacterized protein n=1 Tax=Lentimicrobium saccharophilum TaxID=1678841 RepID=A0A0S7C376_9BACT|nr:hypothetical protein [Lentimicrobium saccharophilum]GAP43878.1 hypothetical protein TBC1_112036 [Lentimicrobium saccharophilum]